ncbi:MAG TPA: hypothetical protein VFO12_12355 [Sphingomicrobium sp.]|nr:hypothetical protein [Sphingomicrobium sp.]
MRHEQLKKHDSFNVVEIPTNDGPTAEALARMELGHNRGSEAAVPDVPPSIGALMVGVYLSIVALFALTIASAGQGPFMIAIDAMFLLAFFTVPAIFLKQERDPARRPSMSRFMSQGMQTYTGHVTGGGALIQMFVVPVLLAFAVLAIGIIAALL